MQLKRTLKFQVLILDVFFVSSETSPKIIQAIANHLYIWELTYEKCFRPIMKPKGRCDINHSPITEFALYGDRLDDNVDQVQFCALQVPHSNSVK